MCSARPSGAVRVRCDDPARGGSGARGGVAARAAASRRVRRLLAVTRLA
ncbi:hypothetical protein [Amycolatopsis sp. NBRC 101858]|nr:hypothetical protein [Amycolatopsis sp. NBRC 101858]